MPNVAFAYIYGPSLNITLNDPTYMNYLLETVTTEYVNGVLTTTKSTQTLTNNCEPGWLGSYN